MHSPIFQFFPPTPLLSFQIFHPNLFQFDRSLSLSYDIICVLCRPIFGDTEVIFRPLMREVDQALILVDVVQIFTILT